MKKAAFLLAPLLATGSVFAQSVPGEDVIADLGDTITSLSTAGFTVLGVLLAATIGMKLVKKFANKAS